MTDEQRSVVIESVLHRHVDTSRNTRVVSMGTHPVHPVGQLRFPAIDTVFRPARLLTIEIMHELRREEKRLAASPPSWWSRFLTAFGELTRATPFQSR